MRKLTFIGWLAAAFLLILGAKLWLIAAFGTTLPWWDQWACHGVTYLQYFKTSIPLNPEQAALVEPTLSLKALLAPHCEHRLVFTRLYALLLLALNGQWDARLEMVVNAFLHALTGIALALMFWRLAGRRHLPLFCVASVLIFGLPFSWEATLYSACISHYALLALALAALWLTIVYPVGSWLWLLGLACAAADLLTMGSGFFAALAILAIALLRWIKDRERRSAAVWMALAGLSVLIAGMLLAVTVPGHASIQSHRLIDLLSAIAQRCAWPNSGYPWLAVPAWLPFIVITARALLTRGQRPVAEQFALGLGLWLLLQIAAMAFGRYGVGIASRHTVILSLGIPLNLFCAMLLWQSHDQNRRSRILKMAIVGLWIGQFVPGLWALSRQAILVEAPLQKHYYTQCEKNVKAFIRSDNIAELEAKPMFEIPYPDAHSLAAFLRNPAMRAILPPGINPAPIEGAGSKAAAGLVKLWAYIFWSGFALMLALACVEGKAFVGQCSPFRKDFPTNSAL